MPKPLSTAYQQNIEAGVGSATCVLITLRDSSQLAFSTWSDFFTYLGVAYDPNEIAQITEVSSQIGTGVITLTVTGLLGAYLQALGRPVTADDARFLFSGAKAVIFNVFPSDLAAGQETLATGELGEIKILSQTAFSFEFRSLMQRAAIQYGLYITQNCHKQFGVQNFNCTGCTATPITHSVAVTSISADGLTIAFSLTPNRTLTNGTILGASGGNSKVAPMRIKSYTVVAGVSTVVLSDSLPYLVSVGDSLVATEGCRKDSTPHEGGITDCTFYNGSDAPAGFSPDVPGVDRLTTAGS